AGCQKTTTRIPFRRQTSVCANVTGGWHGGSKQKRTTLHPFRWATSRTIHMTHIVRQFTLVVSILLLFASNLLCQSAQQLPPHPSKEPIVKDRSKSTKSQTSGSEKQPESERKEDDHKAQPQAEPYPVQIVSQPRDSWYVRTCSSLDSLSLLALAP